MQSSQSHPLPPIGQNNQASSPLTSVTSQSFNNANHSESEQKEQQNISIQDDPTTQQNQSTPGNMQAGNNPGIKKKNKKKKMQAGLVANLIETQYPVVKKVVASMLGMKVIRDAATDEWDLFWTDNAVNSETVAKLKPYQKINHFPGMYTLSRKNYLARNLIKMQKKFPDDYNFFPKTWVLPSELSQFRNFMESENNPVVIAKPEASSQGRGIFLSKSFQDFQYGEHYVVQKYLKKPFLIDGLKFDLRVYVLVAGCDPLRLYVYKQGLARFATEPYCTPKKQNLNNLFMHLTNYAINKNSQKFEFNSSATEMNKGHKRSLTSILNTLQEMGKSKQRAWQQIKDCIAKTMISAQPLLAHQYRSSQPNNYLNNMCFQILGFDIILDQHLKPEVLEVNYTPSFTTDTPLDLQIKKNLIHDAIVLMNLTNKAKNEVIVEKKREMKERTLTGKNINQRENRQGIVDRGQITRNIWESKHLGNFERILPVILELPQITYVKLEKKKKSSTNNLDQALSCSQFNAKTTEIINQQPTISVEQKQRNKKYQIFLEYSLQSYQNNTGANIRRNVKAGNPNTGSNLSAVQAPMQSQGFGEEQEKDKQEKDKQGSRVEQTTVASVGRSNHIKYTNTENLQKIYKSKFRPMLYKKTSQTAPKKAKDEDEQRKTPLLNKNTSEQQQKPKTSSTGTNPYLASCMQMSNNQQGSQVKPKTVNRNFGNRVVEGYAESRKNVKTASEMKKGLSTVYNVTFLEKKNEKK